MNETINEDLCPNCEVNETSFGYCDSCENLQISRASQAKDLSAKLGLVGLKNLHEKNLWVNAIRVEKIIELSQAMKVLRTFYKNTTIKSINDKVFEFGDDIGAYKLSTRIFFVTTDYQNIGRIAKNIKLNRSVTFWAKWDEDNIDIIDMLYNQRHLVDVDLEVL